MRIFVSAHGTRTLLKARKRRLYAGLLGPAHSAHRTCAPPRKRLLVPRYAWYFFFHHYFHINISRIKGGCARACVRCAECAEIGKRRLYAVLRHAINVRVACAELSPRTLAVRNADVLASLRWGPPSASHPRDVVRGACQVPAIQEATGDGQPVSASREGRIFLTNCIRGALGAIPSGNQATARECAQVLPAKGSERVALHPAAG